VRTSVLAALTALLGVFALAALWTTLLMTKPAFAWLGADATVLDYFWGRMSRADLELQIYFDLLRFTPREIEHLVDVKNVLHAGQYLGVVCACLCVVALLTVRPSLQRVGLWMLGLCAAALLAGAATWLIGGWKPLSNALHGLVFADGSWRFPDGSLILRLYPRALIQEGLMLVSGALLASSALVYIMGRLFARNEEPDYVSMPTRATGTR
jgi:hypothetical protein